MYRVQSPLHKRWRTFTVCDWLASRSLGLMTLVNTLPCTYIAILPAWFSYSGSLISAIRCLGMMGCFVGKGQIIPEKATEERVRWWQTYPNRFALSDLTIAILHVLQFAHVPHFAANHTPVKDAWHGRKLHPSLCDRYVLKNYRAWNDDQIRKKASVWEAFFTLSQWQGDEDVQELRVSELQESGYYAIWQDDSARVSGSEGELIRLPSDRSAFEECLIFQWSSARIPMRDSHSSGCLRKDIVLPDDLNQCWKLSFHLAGPPRHNN